MLESAREYASTYQSEESKLKPNGGNQFEFVQSGAEDLAFLKDGSVDIVVSGE